MSGFPNSPAPFRPVNPWGRAMPKPSRKIAVGVPSRDELYQVHVTTETKKDIPVGPALLKEIAEGFCMAIGVEISKGHERSWSNPRVERVRVLQGV